jgi:glycosyltransferase involved in cell wall biosynthesis
MMKKTKVVTVGNLASNAKFFTEVLNEKYEITNILINEEPIEIAKDIVISRKDNFLIIFFNILKAYFALFNSDLIISYTATLSSVLFRLFFVTFKTKKYFAFATGSDLRDGIHYPKKGRIITKFFKKADVLVFHNNDEHTLNSIRYLKLKNVFWQNMYKQTEFNSNLIDLQYQKKVTLYKSIDDFLNKSFSIFMPSFIEFKEKKIRDKYFCSKGNDIAYDALIKFVETHPSVKIVLRGEGVDSSYAKEYLKVIEKNIMFIQTLDRRDFINVLSMFDVVLDQFEVGAFGGIAIEAASIGKPLLTLPPNIEYYKLDKYPFLQNKDSLEICQNLELFLNDRAYMNQYAKLCQEWVLRNNSSKEFTKLGAMIDHYLKNGEIKNYPQNNGSFF